MISLLNKFFTTLIILATLFLGLISGMWTQSSYNMIKNDGELLEEKERSKSLGKTQRCLERSKEDFNRLDIKVRKLESRICTINQNLKKTSRGRRLEGRLSFSQRDHR